MKGCRALVFRQVDNGAIDIELNRRRKIAHLRRNWHSHSRLRLAKSVVYPWAVLLESSLVAAQDGLDCNDRKGEMAA